MWKYLQIILESIKVDLISTQATECFVPYNEFLQACDYEFGGAPHSMQCNLWEENAARAYGIYF